MFQHKYRKSRQTVRAQLEVTFFRLAFLVWFIFMKESINELPLCDRMRE